MTLFANQTNVNRNSILFDQLPLGMIVRIDNSCKKFATAGFSFNTTRDTDHPMYGHNDRDIGR